jgi:hypothetical protein
MEVSAAERAGGRGEGGDAVGLHGLGWRQRGKGRVGDAV